MSLVGAGGTATHRPRTPPEPTGLAGGSWREKETFSATTSLAEVTMRAVGLLAKGKQVWMLLKRGFFTQSTT